MYILCHYHLFLQSIPSINTNLGKMYFFSPFKQIHLCSIFLCPLKFLASPFLVNIGPFLSVSSRLFINLYIVIKSPLSLLSFNVVQCISFNLASYVRFSNSGTILVAILCILPNFNTCFFLCGDHITSAYSSFGLIIVVIIFLIKYLSRK